MSNLIHLRKLAIDDASDFMEWASDDEVTKWLTWESYRSIEEAKKFFTDVVERHPCFLGICLKDKVIGSISLTKRNGAMKCTAILAYVLSRKYWGMGYMTQAVLKATDIAFKDSEILRVEAQVDSKNLSSQRVLEKAGFEKEGLMRSCAIQKGEVRDRLLYSKLRDDFKESNISWLSRS